MKKKLTVLLAASLAASMLAACGSSTSGSSTSGDASADTTAAEESSSDSGETKTLDVVWFSDNKEGEVFMELAEEYMSEHPNIKIELVETPYGDLDNKLKNMINAGEAPALARMTNLGPFQNQLINLLDYVDDADAFATNFNNGLRYDYDGQILAAPSDVTANGVIYNKTAFEAAGVEVPASEDDIWTWDEFTEALKTVMEKGGVKYGLAYDNTTQRFSTLIYEAGGSLLNEDMTASNINTDATRRTLSWFKQLHDEGVIPTSVWLGSETPQEMFRTGQVACHIGGSWQVANYKDQITDFEWGVTYLPQEARRSSVPGGKWLGAFKNTGVEKEAAEFIEWMSQPEQSKRYCEANGFLSQVKGCESLDYTESMGFAEASDYFAISNNELNASGETPGKEWGYQTFTGAILTDYKDGIASYLAGNIELEDLVSQMEQQANDALADLQ